MQSGTESNYTNELQGNTTSATDEVDRNDADDNDVEDDDDNDNVGGQTTQSPNFASVGPLVNVTLRQTTTTTGRPTKLDELTVQRKQQEQQKLKQSKTTPNDLSTEESSLASSSTSSGVSVIETTLCDCPEIEVTSKVDQINCYFRSDQNSKCAPIRESSWSYIFCQSPAYITMTIKRLT